MNTTPYAAFLAQYAPPRPPAAASLDLNAGGGVIRLTRRPDDAGYEPMTFSAGPASGPPTPEPPAKSDEPTLTPVSRRGPLTVLPATRPATRAKAKFMRAAPRGRASTGPR